MKLNKLISMIAYATIALGQSTVFAVAVGDKIETIGTFRCYKGKVIEIDGTTVMVRPDPGQMTPPIIRVPMDACKVVGLNGKDATPEEIKAEVARATTDVINSSPRVSGRDFLMASRNESRPKTVNGVR